MTAETNLLRPTEFSFPRMYAEPKFGLRGLAIRLFISIFIEEKKPVSKDVRRPTHILHCE